MTRIPRIIHQTWKTPEVPEHCRALVRTWRAHHPGWGYLLWTDDDNRRFIRTYYPDFLPVFDRYSCDIQRADAVRYFLLHQFGGLYVDLDMECLRPVEPLLDAHEVVLVYEPGGHTPGRARMVSNAFMAARPGHALLGAVLDHLRKGRTHARDAADVLATTGPAMLASVVRRCDARGVWVYSNEVAFPLSADNAELGELYAESSLAPLIKDRCVRNGAYALHRWHHSWTANEAGELVNPCPHTVPGFVFHPGLDSPGHDLRNAGRNVPEAAARVRNDPAAAGFNTDGFVKHRILSRDRWGPIPRWRPIPNPAGNEGLYVKVGFRPGLWSALASARQRLVASPAAVMRLLVAGRRAHFRIAMAVARRSADVRELEQRIVDQRWFRYRLVDREQRAIELLPQMRIGRGRDMHEIGWTVERTPEGPRLVIHGLSGVTCRLVQAADGGWHGRRRPHPRWEVRLDPTMAPVTDQISERRRDGTD